MTPVSGELELTRQAAHELGLAARFTGHVGSGEHLPLPSASVDAVVSEGCLHHMDVSVALDEVNRVLVEGGRFGAFDPWRARLYGVGTAIFGKRDRAVFCRPLEPTRMRRLPDVFPNSSVIHHGTFVRYLAIAASKFGIRIPRAWVHRWVLIEDRMTRKFDVLRRNGSSVAVLATKSDANV